MTQQYSNIKINISYYSIYTVRDSTVHRGMVIAKYFKIHSHRVPESKGQKSSRTFQDLKL